MELVIDGRTMALRWPSGVPVTDVSLVLGDTVPVRIRVEHALDNCTPALAVKQTIGSADLIMTVTGFVREDDWQTADWVVNTAPLQEVLGIADSVALVAEVVLVSPDGAQHTSRPIRVTVRRDILPAEYAPPAEVLADWHALIATALANQLPDALHNAGMYVTPVTGSSVLATGAAETPTTMACYAMEWGDELLAGQVPDHGRLRSLNMTYSGASAPGSYWLRIWRLVADAYVLAGVSTPEPLPGSNDPITWRFVPGVSLSRGDKIMMEVCAGPDADHLTTYALGVHGVMTPAKDGRGRADQVAHPVVIVQYDVAPRMTATVDYDEGVSVGGVEVATVTQIQTLGSDVRTASANSQAAAQSAAAARDEAQTAVAGLSITVGTVTTGGPGTQAAATLTPGSTPGSWRMDMTIPQGDVGGVDTSQPYVWQQPQTYDAMINANGGINIPLAVGATTDTAAVSRAYALGMAQAAMMHQTRTYWITSSCTATNGVTINHVVPGCYCEARLGVNQHTSLTMRTTGVVGGANYSKNLGYSLPIRASGGGAGYWSKVSMIIGSGGEWTEYPDAGRDDYRFRPVVGSAPDISRLVDVTIYYDGVYKARVRELIGVGIPRQYVVRTTESAINYNSNTSLASAAYRLVISQSELSYTDALAASVWLIIGGAANDTVIKLADIRGWDTYHTSYAPTLYLDVRAGEYGEMVQLESPTILNGIGNNTYIRCGLEPYQRSWIISETEVPYTDTDSPTA
ncbi:hypothetical protein NKE62_01120 [Akkermansia sp. Marseille-P9185]|uniref:hypothetical protein n=1 Tax=Akkermansia massiliensis TaxID=2927224 RepID=UPI00209C4287|nr:hypothetical protein [Akkermansia massiliensis]MCO8185519.1 hypothetical protein [Akkermansia massiliensis]